MMQSFKVFMSRVLFRETAARKPLVMTPLQAFNQLDKSPDIYHIDPKYKDTWSQGPDLLWLHNTQDKQRKMLKAKIERNLPAPGTYREYIDLPEGQVHIARYFP